jgi:hypothetical protein
VRLEEDLARAWARARHSGDDVVRLDEDARRGRDVHPPDRLLRRLETGRAELFDDVGAGLALPLRAEGAGPDLAGEVRRVPEGALGVKPVPGAGLRGAAPGEEEQEESRGAEEASQRPAEGMDRGAQRARPSRVYSR